MGSTRRCSSWGGPVSWWGVGAGVGVGMDIKFKSWVCVYKAADMRALILHWCTCMGQRGPVVVRCIRECEFARCYVRMGQRASQVCVCRCACHLLCPQGQGSHSLMFLSPSCHENQGISASRLVLFLR